MSDNRKIQTTNVYPPIPIREYDWCAWYDDDGEEAHRYGWSATEELAIEDLKRKFGGEDDCIFELFVDCIIIILFII